jgi:ABC-type uncharacterized transport system fused permease/ATPase subunit
MGGQTSLGEFLNNVSIFGALGSMWGEVYEVLLGMQNCFDALTSVVQYMNLPTETQHRMEQFSKNIELCRLDRQRLAEGMIGNGEYHPEESVDPADNIHIELRELSFKYKAKGLLGSGLRTSTVHLPQGGLYTLIGPQSQGKGTVLKLLGEVIVPFLPGDTRNCESGGGDLVLPSHLRVLHVTSEPMFLEGTLLYNLTFGSSEKKVDRILAIARRFGIADTLLQTIKEDTLEARWLTLLSSTELAILHTVRAFVMNPEVLCIHKPTLFLNSEMADIMYTVLKEFVDNRGLEQDPSTFWQRRPRTCILTARRIDGIGAKLADAVFYVSAESGMRLLKGCDKN